MLCSLGFPCVKDFTLFHNVRSFTFNEPVKDMALYLFVGT